MTNKPLEYKTCRIWLLPDGAHWTAQIEDAAGTIIGYAHHIDLDACVDLAYLAIDEWSKRQ